YGLDLSAGDYCSGVITKNDLRVMVTIEDPTGKELGTFISDDYGNLSFSFVVKSSGPVPAKSHLSRARDRIARICSDSEGNTLSNRFGSKMPICSDIKD